mmetsp:Transcript_68254/g.189539  ORF Transcript_68254/g.189539 Transcript_68254/m.189539 type:complete len:241 (+) Transcript_68254:1339-2061(+)
MPPSPTTGATSRLRVVRPEYKSALLLKRGSACTSSQLRIAGRPSAASLTTSWRSGKAPKSIRTSDSSLLRFVPGPCRTLDHKCSPSLSTIHNVQLSAPTLLAPSHIIVSKSGRSSSCIFFLSAAPRSMNRSEVMPRRHPTTTPHAALTVDRTLTPRSFSYGGGSGAGGYGVSIALLGGGRTRYKRGIHLSRGDSRAGQAHPSRGRLHHPPEAYPGNVRENLVVLGQRRVGRHGLGWWWWA